MIEEVEGWLKISVYDDLAGIQVEAAKVRRFGYGGNDGTDNN